MATLQRKSWYSKWLLLPSRMPSCRRKQAPTVPALVRPHPSSLRLSIQSLASNRGDECPFILDYSNVTLCGRKVWGLLASMEQDAKPIAYAIVEAHLKGKDLNQARRRFASLGWASHCTPAVTKADKFLGTDGSNDVMHCPVMAPGNCVRTQRYSTKSLTIISLRE